MQNGFHNRKSLLPHRGKSNHLLYWLPISVDQKTNFNLSFSLLQFKSVTAIVPIMTRTGMNNGNSSAEVNMHHALKIDILLDHARKSFVADISNVHMAKCFEAHFISIR